LCLSTCMGSWFSLNVLFLRFFFCLLYLKQSYFCYLSLYVYIPRDIFVILLFPYICSLIFSYSRGNPDFCQEKLCWLHGCPDSLQDLCEDVKGGLSKSPGYQEEVSGMRGFVSITVWSLIVSDLEENLTNRIRGQELSRGRNQVRDSSQDLLFFLFFHTCSRRC
jgi:hypothetical protein